MSAPVWRHVASFNATPFLRSAAEAATVPFTTQQREALASIATRVRLPSRKVIYREDSAANWIFAVAEGVVKTYRDLPSGKRSVSAFLFARDLFGLSEHGRYLNTAQAITQVTLYRLPVADLMTLLKHDGEMQLAFLVKVTYELRESQRRAILLNRRDAPGRLAMFVQRMRDHVDRSAKRVQSVQLPMSRSDIAGFLGLSLESVSRAAAELERRGLVKFEGRHLARIADPDGLAALVAAV